MKQKYKKRTEVFPSSERYARVGRRRGSCTKLAPASMRLLHGQILGGGYPLGHPRELVGAPVVHPFDDGIVKLPHRIEELAHDGRIRACATRGKGALRVQQDVGERAGPRDVSTTMGDMHLSPSAKRGANELLDGSAPSPAVETSWNGRGWGPKSPAVLTRCVVGRQGLEPIGQQSSKSAMVLVFLAQGFEILGDCGRRGGRVRRACPRESTGVELREFLRRETRDQLGTGWGRVRGDLSRGFNSMKGGG